MRSLIFKISAISLFALLAINDSAAASDRSYSDQNRHAVTSVRSRNNRTKSISSKRVYYKRPTTSVRSVRVVSPSATVVRKRGVNYYFHDGRYYRRDVDKYISVVPPLGVRVARLPIGYQIVKHFGRSYYYYLGTYYSRVNSGYEVVSAPQDILVSSLPEYADIVTIDGKRHYICNGYIYDVVIIPNGARAFKVVGQIDMI